MLLSAKTALVHDDSHTHDCSKRSMGDTFHECNCKWKVDLHFQGDGTTEEIRPERITLIWVRTAVATLAFVKSEILETMYTSVGVVTIHCM